MNESGALDRRTLTCCARAAILAPSGRELLISVGAAAFTLRVVIRRAGRIPAVAVLPVTRHYPTPLGLI
jgi:hypothetical protein